jgi:hypothetical protein
VLGDAAVRRQFPGGNRLDGVQRFVTKHLVISSSGYLVIDPIIDQTTR